MKRKLTPDSAFFPTASSLMLCMLTVTNIPPMVGSHLSDFAFPKEQTQPQVLAQIPGSGHHSGSQHGNSQSANSQQILNANTLANNGDLTGAEEVLRKLIKKFPQDSDAHYNLGNVLFRQGRNEDAIQEYLIAIHLNSQYALAHNAIGQVYASQQQWSSAIAEYRKALSINPDYGDALTNLAQPLWEQGFHQEARASLEKALKIFQAQDRPDKVKQIEQILQHITDSNSKSDS